MDIARGAVHEGVGVVEAITHILYGRAAEMRMNLRAIETQDMVHLIA